MPSGEGWWLHPRREPRAVFEHLSAVLADPRAYGLSLGEVASAPGEATEDHRRRVLTAVLQKGWIRVRSHRSYTVIEYWKLNRRVADAIWNFHNEVLGGGAMAEYQLHEIASGRTFSVKAAQFFDDIESHLGRSSKQKNANGGERLYLIGLAMGQGRRT